MGTGGAGSGSCQNHHKRTKKQAGWHGRGKQLSPRTFPRSHSAGPPLCEQTMRMDQELVRLGRIEVHAS
jgi:hypothetical protein